MRHLRRYDQPAASDSHVNPITLLHEISSAKA